MGFCSACGTAALEGAKFCMNCGAKIAPSCTGCGQELPEGARFCPNCGTASGAPAGATPQAGTAPSPDPIPAPAVGAAGEERRIITALFADLAGFTSHTERADPEDVRERLTTYHKHVREEVERYDGRIEKLLGDGVFAVFGVPTAHEDDPERAVRAALRIQETVVRLNEADASLALTVRIAVTTGEAIVQMNRTDQDREGIVGDVVNTASRLEAVAPPGGVVVDETTYHASNSMIDYRALTPVELKGKAEPVPIWQAEGAKSRYGVAVEEQVDTPFIGRDSELGLLIDTFDRVVGERSAQLVTVIGEPGVGKSRLMNEFRRVVDGRPEVVWWRQGRCLPLGEGITFWAVGEVVKAQAGIFDSDPPWQAQQKLRDSVYSLIDDRSSADWVLSRLAPLAGTDDADSTVERSELFNAWQRYFEALAARNPLILVIEDLHWADDALVEFLDHLIEWTVDAPIILIATARPELLRNRPTWGAGKLNATSIGLKPLSDSDTKELLASLMPGRLMTAEAQQRLLDRCGGNPLYATEFVRLIVERGSSDRIDDLALPSSVQAITAARLDLLDPEDRLVLQVAAVAGKVFWSGAVAFVLPISRENIRLSLRRLASRDLIRPIRKSSLEGEDEWIFGHALIRDVAYGQIARSDRAARHEQIGRWIETTSRDRMTDVSEVLAYHFAEAMGLQSDPSEELVGRAYSALMAAGTRTKALDAKRAVRFFREAAGVTRSRRDEGLALIAAGKTTGSVDETMEFGERAEAIFEELGDPENQVRGISLRGQALWYLGDTEAAGKTLDTAQALIADRMESAIGAEVLASLASYYWRTGRPLEAEAVLDRARPIVERYGDFRTRVRQLTVTAGTRLQMGDLSGLELNAQVLEMCLDRGESNQAASAYNNLVTHQIFFDPAERVLAKVDEGVEFVRSRGLDKAEVWTRMTRLESLFPLGRLAEIVAETEALLADEGHGSQAWVVFRVWQIYMRHFMGKRIGDQGEVFEAASRIEDPQVSGPAAVGRVMAEVDAGDKVAARATADGLRKAFEGEEHLQALNFPLVADALIEIGHLDQVVEMNVSLGPAWRYQEACRLRTAGLVAEARGEMQEAVEAFRSSIAIFDVLGHRFGPVWAGIPLARVLLGLGREAEAHAILDGAALAAREMSAGRFLSEISDLRAESEAEAN